MALTSEEVAEVQFAVAMAVEDTDGVGQGVAFDWVAWTEVHVVEVFDHVEGAVEVVEPVAFHTVEWHHAAFKVVEPGGHVPAVHSVERHHAVFKVVEPVAFHSVEGHHTAFEVVEPGGHVPAVHSVVPWHGFVTVKVVEFTFHTFTGEFTAHDLVVFQRIVDVTVESWVVGADGFHC